MCWSAGSGTLKMPKIKERHINIKAHVKIESQEVNSDSDQISGFQNMSGGKSYRYTGPLVEFLEALELECQCSCDVVHSGDYLSYKYVCDRVFHGTSMAQRRLSLRIQEEIWPMRGL